MISLPICRPAAFRPRLCWHSVAGLRHTAYGIRLRLCRAGSLW
ncbi:MAG: hypothetical protein ACR2L2_01495 [Acidobacteriota bacterium]